MNRLAICQEVAYLNNYLKNALEPTSLLFEELGDNKNKDLLQSW